MATDPVVRDFVHKARLNAHANELYWRSETSRHESISKRLALLAAVSTGSVAIASWTVWAVFPWAWKIVTGIGAVAATVNLVYDYKSKVTEHALLHAKWLDQRTTCEGLWIAIETGGSVTPAEISAAKAREGEIEKGESKISIDDKRRERAYVEAHRALELVPPSREQRGLPPL